MVPTRPARTAIAPPPPGSAQGEARDDAAYDALQSATRAVLKAATAAGWHRSEAEGAMLAVLVGSMVESGERAAVAGALKQALRAVEAGAVTSG